MKDTVLIKAAAALGRRGGMAGTGAKKRRPLKHYRRMAALSAEAKAARAKAE
jgi:hypothetical protein